MKFRTRILSVAISAALLAVSAAGCSSPNKEPEATPAPVATPAPLPEGIPADIVERVAGIDKHTSVMTVDGADVTAESLLYWITASADQFDKYGALNWTADMDGVSMGDYLLNNAVETAKFYQVISNKAMEAGYVLTPENQATIDAQVESYKSDMASQTGGDGETAYQFWLGYLGLDDQSFRGILENTLKVNYLTESLFGTDGTQAPSKEELDAWLADNGVLRAKHILVKAADSSDEAMAAALEKANGLRQQLKENNDDQVFFDKLMSEQSEDPGSQSNPLGYVFGPGEMVQEFYDGTAALEVGQISEPVQSSYGYHIILRLDPNNDDGRGRYTEEKMTAQIDAWIGEAKVEQGPDYAKLDPETCYTKLAEVRGEIMEAMQDTFFPEETTPAETGTPAPTETPAG